MRLSETRVQKPATRSAHCRAWRTLRKARGAASQRHKAEGPWASELPSAQNSMTQRKGWQSRFSWSSSLLFRSLLFLRSYLALCRHSINDGTVGTHQILGRECANLGGCDFGQVFRDPVNQIEAAVEKHSMRERRGATDRDLELIVPIGSHLGDDAIQILLAWSFVNKFLNGGIVSCQELIFGGVGWVDDERRHKRRPIIFKGRAQRPIHATVNRQRNLLLLDESLIEP